MKATAIQENLGSGVGAEMAPARLEVVGMEGSAGTRSETARRTFGVRLKPDGAAETSMAWKLWGRR